MKKSIILPNIVKLEKIAGNFPSGYFRKKFNISDDKKIVIYLGRLSWIKGFDTLIPAFKAVVKKHPEAILVIAGGDDKGYKKNVQLLITNYQLQDGVIFTGMLTGADKIAAYQDSDVFVLPSYSESFGMSIVEAMATGLPVVVSKGVGISAYIKQVKAGIVVEKNEVELSGAILKILNNSDLAKKMGEAGRELIKNEFSSEKIAEKFLKEYNEILQGYEKK